MTTQSQPSDHLAHRVHVDVNEQCVCVKLTPVVDHSLTAMLRSSSLLPNLLGSIREEEVKQL